MKVNTVCLSALLSPVLGFLTDTDGCVDAQPNCDFMDTHYHMCLDVENARVHCKQFCQLCDIVDGAWSDWSAWSVCDATCGQGDATRTRTCTNPAPAHGGHDCNGTTTQRTSCLLQKCPEQCASGWLQTGSTCYHFSHEIENWPAAELICRTFGGNLAEVRTQAELNLITQRVTQGRRKYWIGLNDIDTEDQWRWIGSGQRATVTFWDPGQPDNDDNNENCVHTDGTSVGKWNDENCGSHLLYYICEKRLGEGNSIPT